MMEVMRFGRHVIRLFLELFRYGLDHDVWWPIALTALLLIVGALSFGVTVTTPYLYTVF